MLNDDLNKFIEKKLVLTKIIWGAMVFSNVILFVMLSMINSKPIEWNILPAIGANPVIILFSLVSVVLAVISSRIVEFIQDRISKKKFDRDEFITDLEQSKGDRGQPIYKRSEMTLLKSFSDEQLKVFRIYNGSTMAYILRLSLIEAISLFGFIIAVSFKNNGLFMPFGFASLILFIAAFPRFKFSKFQ